MATVLLCRHGETTWNHERRVQGWAPTSLTDRGRDQAQALATHLAGEYDVDRVVSSDLERAAETARFIGRETDVDPKLDRAWRERNFGRLQGLHYLELFEGYPEYALGHSGYAAAEAEPEGGESLLAMRERVLDAWDGLLAELGDSTVAVVTHGGPLYAVTGVVKGLDIVTATLEQRQSNCALNEFRVTDGAVELVLENATGFQPESTDQENY